MMDDKNWVIAAVCVMGLALILTGDLDPSKENILISIFSGLFGIAVGRATK